MHLKNESLIKKKVYYKQDFKAIISFEFPYNDNKIIILMNIV